MTNITIKSKQDVMMYTIFLRRPEINLPKEMADDIKRAIRSFLRRGDKVRRRTFHADYDGCIEVFPLPKSIDNAKDAEQWFMEEEYIHYHPTYYDCTGQAFTSWYKIFRKADGFWAYHWICRDV